MAAEHATEIALLLGIAVAVFVAQMASACDELWLAGGEELWIVRESGSSLLASDVKGIAAAKWSPDGELIVYVQRFLFDGAGPAAEIVVVRDDGAIVTRIAISREKFVNAVETLGWRNQQRVFLEGHVNPSTTLYLEWEVATGKLLEEKPGSWFAVSPDGEHIAQRANVPHGAPVPYDSAMLLVDDKRVYPAVGDEAYRRFTGPLAWSPDSSRIALLEANVPGQLQLVVVELPSESAMHFSVPGSTRVAELSWDGPDTVELRDHEKGWRLDTATGAIEQISEPLSAQEPPSALSQMVGDAELHRDDVHCVSGD